MSLLKSLQGERVGHGGEPRILTSRISSPLLLAPPQEFAEQGLAICLGQRPTGSPLSEEGLKVGTNIFLRGRGRTTDPFEHLLREAVASPARYGRGQIDVAPFGMARRGLEFVPLG